MGLWTSLAGRAFTNTLKNGSLIRIEKGKLGRIDGNIVMDGILISPLGSYNCNGIVLNDSIIMTLENSKGQNRGTITGTRGIPGIPLTDYPLLVDQALQVTRDSIYNRSVLKRSSTRRFERRISRVAVKVTDDIEMVFAFYFHSRELTFSHYGLVRPEQNQNKQADEQPRYAVLEERNPFTAYLRITSFAGSAHEIDSLFSIIKEKEYSNLIIDLRNNSGGNIEPALTLARNIADSICYDGIFLTQKWFNHHEAPPLVEEYVNFPFLSEANVGLLLDGIHDEEGICLKIIPEAQTYQGQVFILTSKRTASTCEPLIYGAKQYGLATIVGERTAGAMLNGESFVLTDAFRLFLPTAEYCAADGYRIDMKGVEPGVMVESDDALEYVLENIIK